MIDTLLIRSLAEKALPSEKEFVVDVKVSPGNEVTVILDSDDKINIDQVVAIARDIEAGLDRDKEDFELSVMSAGVGQPLTMLRQYLKLIGKDVEIVLRSGGKVIGELRAADETSVTIAYSEKVAVEGRKRKELKEFTHKYLLDEIKSTVEHLNFK